MMKNNWNSSIFLNVLTHHKLQINKTGIKIYSNGKMSKYN